MLRTVKPKQSLKRKEHFRAMPMEFKDSAYHIPWFIVGARSNLELSKGVHVIPLDLLLDRFAANLDQYIPPSSTLTTIIFTSADVSCVWAHGRNQSIPREILREIYAHAKEIFITLGLIDPEKEADF